MKNEGSIYSFVGLFNDLHVIFMPIVLIKFSIILFFYIVITKPQKSASLNFICHKIRLLKHEEICNALSLQRIL